MRAAGEGGGGRGGGEEGKGVQETFVTEAGVECLYGLQDAHPALGGGGTAVRGCEGLVDEVGVEIFELGAHSQEDLVGETGTAVGERRVGAEGGDPVGGEEIAEAVEMGAGGGGEAEVGGGELVGEEGGEGEAGA